MDLKFKHIGKFEVMFELALGYESGDRRDWIMEKTRGWISRQTILLSNIKSFFRNIIDGEENNKIWGEAIISYKIKMN